MSTFDLIKHKNNDINAGSTHKHVSPQRQEALDAQMVSDDTTITNVRQLNDLARTNPLEYSDSEKTNVTGSIADEIINHACHAADCGFYVFPMLISQGQEKPNKKPLVEWKKEATRDHEKIKAWKYKYPNLNGYGIKEGNGTFILDFDGISEEKFREYLAELNEIIPVGKTFRQRTISGRGYHVRFKCDPDDTPISFNKKWGELKGGIGDRVVLSVGPGSQLGTAKYEPIDGTSLDYVKTLTSDEVKRLVQWCGGNGDGRSKPEFNVTEVLDENGNIPVGQRHPTYLSTAGLLKQKGFTPKVIREMLAVLNNNSVILKDVTELDDIVTYVMDFNHVNPIRKNQEIADVMQKLYYKELRYCFDERHWKFYNGVTWQEDNRHKIVTYVEDCIDIALNWIEEQIHSESLKDVPTRELRESAYEESHDERKELKRKWELKKRFLAAREKLDNIQSQSAHDNICMYLKARLPITCDEFDRDKWLLNVKNCTIDLRSSEAVKHHYEHFISKVTLIDYDPNAESEKWEAYLKRVLPSQRLREFFQCAVGYSLTGLTQEEAVFFCYGNPATGKSTGLEAVLKMVGDYGIVSNFSVFAKHYESNGPSEYIARFEGVRFCMVNEVNENVEINSALLKSFASGDKKNARIPYARRSHDFYPIQKTWLIGNYRPKIKYDDDGVWRRFYVIPFESVIPENERDKALKDLFKDDDEIQQAILAWAVQGCLEWQRQGLNPPKEVIAANIDYKVSMSPIYMWFSECCVKEKYCWTPTYELYDDYKRWRNEIQDKTSIVTERPFGRYLKNMGFVSERDTKTKVRGWRGVRLRTDDDGDSDGDEILSWPYGHIISNFWEFLVTKYNMNWDINPTFSDSHEKVSKKSWSYGHMVLTAKSENETDTITKSLKEYTKRYLENPTIKPSTQAFIIWLTGSVAKSVSNNTSECIIKTGKILEKLLKDDTNFSEKIQRAKAISIGGGA